MKAIWDAAVESNHKYEEYAAQIYSVCRGNKQLCEQVIYVLFEIAAADSDVSSGEIKFIKELLKSYILMMKLLHVLRTASPILTVSHHIKCWA